MWSCVIISSKAKVLLLLSDIIETYLLLCLCVIIVFVLFLLSAPKPFAEMSVMIRNSEHSDINQFKYVL